MDEKTLKDFTKKRSELIASLMSSMDGQVKDNQKKLLEKVLEKFVDKLEKDENGNVKNNDRNRNLLIQFDDIFKEYQKKEARDTVGLLLQSVGSIINFNQKYFSALDGQARTLPIIPKVKDFMKVWLGIKGDVVEPNGYLDKLVSNDPAKIALKNQAMKIVIGQEGFEDAKKQIKTLIDGNQNTMGALEKHHRNFAFDLYSQIDRATSDVIRNDLGFVFAIYEGGLIETSRIFCEEHDGNIYHISEIKDFNPTEAKPPNYNPITDLGGYGCRHHLNWISTAMAKAMGKDVDKFLNGVNKGNISVEKEKNVNFEFSHSFLNSKGIKVNQYNIDGGGYARVEENKTGFIVSNIIIAKENQGKGIATDFYVKMNNLSLEKTGKPLQSIKADKTGLIELSDEGKAMWDSFVKKGIAIKISEKKYRFKKK